MKSEMILALEQLVNERGLSMETLGTVVEEAVLKAYKNNYGQNKNAEVKFDLETGEISVYSVLVVAEEVIDTDTQISLEDAHKINRSYVEGDVIKSKVSLSSFGRVAASTAKQIIQTKLLEAEKNMILAEFSERQNELVTGVIHRVQKGIVYVSIGRTEAVMLQQEQNPIEDYLPGRRFNFAICEIKVGKKGPTVYLSRTSANLIRLLFDREVPEIESGEVVIKAVSREAGSRTKISVYSENPDIDPVGACVGPKGIRVENVVNELHGEKIDVIEWNENPAILISNALSPAKVLRVEIYEDENAALVVVPEDQLSLAIGKEGQNVRLAARLTGWKIDIKDEEQYKEYLREIGEYDEVYGDY